MSAMSMVDAPAGVPADTLAAAKNAYNNALIKLNNQRQGVLRNYGYTAKFDPATGQMSGLGVDSANPYGQLQLTLRSQALEDDSAKNDAIGRGLHGGLANQAETDLQFTHHGQTSQLASNLVSQMDDFQGQQQGALQEYNNTLYQAQLQAARDAILQQLFNNPHYGDDSGGGGGKDNDSGPDYNDPNSYASMYSMLNPVANAKKKVVSKVASKANKAS